MESSKVSFIIPGVGIESKYLDISYDFNDMKKNELAQELLLKIASDDAKGLLPQKVSSVGYLFNKVLENCTSVKNINELRRILNMLGKIGTYGKLFSKLFSIEVNNYLNQEIALNIEKTKGRITTLSETECGFVTISPYYDLKLRHTDNYILKINSIKFLASLTMYDFFRDEITKNEMKRNLVKFIASGNEEDIDSISKFMLALSKIGEIGEEAFRIINFKVSNGLLSKAKNIMKNSSKSL